MIRYRLRRAKFWLRSKLGLKNPELGEIVGTTIKARADAVAANIKANNCLLGSLAGKLDE